MIITLSPFYWAERIVSRRASFEFALTSTFLNPNEGQKKVKNMSDEALKSQLEAANRKIRELEESLKALRRENGITRHKIDKMSDEVVDSNPYR